MATNQTTEQLKENGRKGGIASGEKRRQKKALKETIQAVMSMPLYSGKKKMSSIESIKALEEVGNKNIEVQTAILNDNGRQESVTTGEIETIYLFKGDIQPEDQIYINGEMFIVTNVTFQANIEKKISKRLQQLGTTLISLRN